MIKKIIIQFLSFVILIGNYTQAQSFNPSEMDELLYGVAYYYEYMPYERLEEDVRMMKACGINVVRICESTWAYLEPSDGVFNLEYVGRILDVMYENDIKVIIGTPTYAFPAWLAKKHPDILLTSRTGQRQYGSRQIMDITNEDYLFHAERIIRNLIDYVHNHPAVIGYQVDNETKHYGTEGANVQTLFKQYLKDKFDTPEAMNSAFGLHYWSNSVFEWEDMPSTLGTINASLRCEFEKFQRSLVTKFLAWQVAIVNEYKNPEQFVTQNFDLQWRNMSYSIQPDVDHFEACRPLDIAGIDIYHATGKDLDGAVIGFAGDLARSMKNTNYLVVETQAQSINPSSGQYLLFPGQLRLQAYSHTASGANMVAYWPWHSIHNSAETYWKGLLSHDLEPNPTYDEASQIAAEFKRIGPEIVNLRKENKVAIYFSNESLSAIDKFPIHDQLSYNDVVRKYYDMLYKMNIECDFIDHTTENIMKYDLILVPPLYVASDDELNRLVEYVLEGGHVLISFKSGFSNENVQVRTERQPGIIRAMCGISYQQFTSISKLPLILADSGSTQDVAYASFWAELLIPEGAEVIARYDHPYWNKYAAIVRNDHGKGRVSYLGTWPSETILKELIEEEIKSLDMLMPENQFPIIIRNGLNSRGESIHYIFNYSQEKQEARYVFNKGVNLFSGEILPANSNVSIKPWDLIIVKEQ